ncbi:MAG: type I-B CRISPR-associated protein Cas7/Csh2 [Bacteroidota bacterium]
MSEIISNRSELLFLYDIENANPNGDPLNENRPRFDTESSTILVSDVRLKRTIRDYWFEYKGYNGQGDNQDIFVRETKYEDGGKEYIKDGKRRAKDFQELANVIIDKCIDIRVFGGVIPLSNDSITYIGPVQFQMGKSLNKTEIIEEQGTGAFASGDKKGQATFRTEYKIPYAIIGFNGVINEKSAQYSKMNEEDKALLIEGIWDGTRNLISRSKFGQAPLFLLTIEYNEPFYIGNLRQRLKLNCGDMNELQIRSTNDFKLDVTELVAVLKANKAKIANINLRVDSRLSMVNNGQVIVNISKDEL